ncbi:esterase [soil metagenome]
MDAQPGFFSRLAGASLALILLASCSTPLRSYYDKGASLIPAEPGKAAVAVIEFDEHGDYWDAQQVARADAMISKYDNPILVTFVHGWRHDARIDDADLIAFRKFLDVINQVDKASKRQVCGVYIGWRGASVQERGLDGLVGKPSAPFTFFGRKKITDQMAGVPFTNTVWNLAETTRKKDGSSILIGHSFGGRIVERTLGPAAVAQMNNRKPMPYNLTFLINPATESIYARQLKLALRNWPKNQPAIIALAAKNDFATGKAWPLALSLPNGIRSRDYLVKGVGKESQKSYVVATVGNDKRQWTHEILPEVKQALGSHPDITATNASKSTNVFPIRLRDDKSGEATLCRIAPLTSVDAKHQIESNAYWVIPLEKNILSGHGGVPAENGIFCQSMGDLMAGLIGQVGALTQEGPMTPRANPAGTEKSDAPKPSFSMPRLITPF